MTREKEPQALLMRLYFLNLVNPVYFFYSSI